MIVDTKPEKLDEIGTSRIFQQTSYWGRLKKELGASTKAFKLKIDKSSFTGIGKGFIHEDMLVVIHRLNARKSFAYVPYGPQTEPPDDIQGTFLEELSECIRSWLPADCMNIRYDLPWESQWAKDDNFYNSENRWEGPPPIKTQEFRFNFNTQKWNLNKSNTDILPANTVFIDLKKKDDEILAGMKPKTRYNIRLSGKKGVTVKTAGIDEIGVWYDLYRETASRNNINLNDLEYFKTALAINNKELTPSTGIKLLIAEKNNYPLAAMFLAISKNRATYLYGASSSGNKNLMGSYALQWAAIKIARKNGCTEYDMFGVAPAPDPSHPMFGLYRFKTGFGGDIYHRMGCWDFPLSHEDYMLYETVEMQNPGYHI